MLIQNNDPLPHAQISEKTVISVFLGQIELLDDFPNLSEAHFYLPDCQIAFGIIREIKESTFTGDIVAQMLHKLQQRGKLDAVGGNSGVTTLYTYSPYPAHLGHHIGILNQMLARRLAIKAALTLGNEAYGCGEDIDRVLEAASGPITEIHEAATASKPPRTRLDAIRARLSAYKARLEGRQSPMGFSTIPELDRYLKGGKPGRMWVIGAYPQGGKSVMAGQICTDCALEGRPAGYVTLEMSEDDVWDRCLIQASRVDAAAFMSPVEYAKENDVTNPSNGILNAITNGTRKLLDGPLHVVKPENRNLRTVCAAVRRLVRDHKCEVVAIDYVQLVIPSVKGNDETGISEVSHAFQELALELGILLLVPSQLNADGDTKRGRVIEEDADAVIRIHQCRDKEHEDFQCHYHCVIDKDRHNGNGGQKVSLILDRKLVRFIYGWKEEPKKQKQPSPGTLKNR